MVSEALWKQTSMVAGRAGGIPPQLQDGAGGFLIDSVEECAEQVLWLLHHPEEGRQLAAAGRDLGRRRFLLTRRIADELRLYGGLLSGQVPAALPAAQSGLAGDVRDQVCGMRLDPGAAITAEYRGQRYVFCAQSCREVFLSVPERYLRAAR